MKKILIWALCVAALLMITGCAANEPEETTTEPSVTEPATQAPTQAPTEDPFQYESEIDFSDFETQPPATQTSTEPEQTPTEAVTEPTEPAPKPTVKPTESVVKPTEPPVEPTESPADPTQPEETQPPVTTAPSVGADGYNNLIVRP